MRHLPRTRTTRLAAATCATALAVAGLTTVTAAPATAGGLSPYVALGDSYSSGESLGAYLSGTDTAINQCHRTNRAWPVSLGWNFNLVPIDFKACSGAITNDFYAPDHNGYKVSVDAAVPAQISNVNWYTQLVTLTVGGNDVGFSSVLGACLYGDQQRATRTDCSANPALTSAVQTRIDALAGKGTATTPHGLPITPLSKLIKDIRAKAPNAEIIIGTYPQLVSKSFTGTECTVGGLTVKEDPTKTMPLYLSKTDVLWFNDTISKLDQVILDAPKQTGLPGTYAADVRPYYGDHSQCGSTTPWITPVKGTVSAATGATTIDASSMHPTQTGSDAYFWAFRAAVV